MYFFFGGERCSVITPDVYLKFVLSTDQYVCVLKGVYMISGKSESEGGLCASFKEIALKARKRERVGVETPCSFG